ncbi:MAG: hypothetical protein Q4F41_12015 [Eubacteriales bacterium]|nr:hypothetical protein [Eubacteriales bacterium]
MKVIYSKFSNERNYRFAIRTDICEEEDGTRFVRKVCAFPEGQLHMAELYRWYQVFSKACEGTWLNYNKCEIITGGVRLEYIEGQSLEEYLEEVEKEKGMEAMADLFRKYLYEIRDMHSGQVFEETAQFRNVFGEFQADAKALGLRCAPATNIDLVCGNILLHDNTGTVIDYEWSFDFPIPVNFLLYRNIFYFKEHAGRDYLRDYNFYKEMGITPEEIKAYDKMEENLQHYVCRDHIPVRDLYDTISPGLIEMDLRGHFENVQIYYDAGNGFREENSKRFPVRQKKVSGILELEPGWSALRIDPGSSSCFVEIMELSVDGQDMTERAGIAGGIRSGQYLCFEKDDPAIILGDLPQGAKKLAFSFQIWPVDELPMKKASEWVWQLELHSRVLSEMQNTKVWKVYQKYRDMVERKHE